MIARWFWREWRSPSLLIVWLALSLAVACVLALGNISDRMEKGLSQQSREFMAGDRALRSSREVPQAWLEEAQKRGLKVGKQLTFATMTFAGDTPQLANVKAVDDIYPMYGDLQTNPPGLKPQAGSVLLAPRLMALLNLKTGDTIDVGDATLRIAGEVIQEPDSGFNPFQMAPRLMMNLADVDKTGAVQPGSRVTWRYKFGGNENQLDGYEKWLLPQLKPEQRWYGLEQDEGALGRSMERSQQFLLLSALLTLLLAVAAVAVAMNHYCRSRYDLVAILKTLGAGRAQLRKLIVGQWLMVLTLSAVTGGAIGLLFENVLMVLLKPVLPAALPPASLWPWLWALGTMTVISLLVGLRPYRLLLATQPLRVLRNDVVANVWPLKFYLPIVSVVVVLLLAGLMGGSMLLWAVLAGAVVLALLCGVLGWMLLNVLRRMTLKSLPLRLAVSRLLRQPWSTLSQLSAFSLSFMLLALLLQDLQHTVDFDLVFLAMDPGYAPEGRKHLEENAKRLDIPLEIFDTDVLRVAGVHSAEHPCFLCAKMRRGYLYTEARRRGCNKIALGHHYDDAIGTVLMGLIYGGQVQAMLPRVKAKNYEGMELIRPLYFTREQSVIDWAEYCGLTFLPCDCPAKKLESDTKRAEIKQLIASLAANNPQIEANIFNAVKNVDTAKLLGWRDANGKHNFLDQFE